MPEKVNLNAYFERIGFAGSIAPSLATLEMLHALHPAAIPFENLNPLMGEPVLLDQTSLERKLLAEKRGGYCFEHNLLFMRILRDLDYVVRPVMARVLWNKADTAAIVPSHLALIVEVNGQNYLADVGFGGLTLTAPLRLRAEVSQSTPHENFRLLSDEGQWTLEVEIGDAWRPVYAFSLDAVEDETIAELNAQLATAPTSPFTQELRVALSPTGRRLKLYNTTFTIQLLGEEKQERTIASIEALRSILTEEFGLVLPNAERLEPALSRLLPEIETEADQAPAPQLES